jgi:hypothetical protein
MLARFTHDLQRNAGGLLDSIAGTLFAVFSTSKEEHGHGWPNGQDDR